LNNAGSLAFLASFPPNQFSRQISFSKQKVAIAYSSKNIAVIYRYHAVASSITVRVSFVQSESLAEAGKAKSKDMVIRAKNSIASIFRSRMWMKNYF